MKLSFWRGCEIVGVAVTVCVLLGMIAGSQRNASAWHDSATARAERVKEADARADIALARYAEAASSVKTAIDTVERYTNRYITKWDTVPVPSTGWDSATVEEYKTGVSHFERSCRLLVGAARLLMTSCDSALAAKDAQVATRDGVIVALQHTQPDFWQRHWKAAAVLSSFGTAYIVVKVRR